MKIKILLIFLIFLSFPIQINGNWFALKMALTVMDILKNVLKKNDLNACNKIFDEILRHECIESVDKWVFVVNVVLISLAIICIFKNRLLEGNPNIDDLVPPE